VIGAGGAAVGQQTVGNNGNNSSFNGLVAIAGGGGANSTAAGLGTSAKAGGSGGGGQSYYGNGTTYIAGAGTAGQGFAGTNGATGYTNAGGGGGAGGAGTNTTTANIGGNGGPGIFTSISGSLLYYASGGGAANGGVASAGGGGNGSGGSGNGVDGTANTGGGGGGGWTHAGGGGGAGGSGVVIISYPTGSITASGGTMTITGGNTVHTFTGSGSFVVSSINSKARTIPNTGYVELTRTSNGSVWRRYDQPSAASAAVPDQCSGSASSSYGWSNASAGPKGTYAANLSAQPISTIYGPTMNPGSIYLRKDFSVTTAGTYQLNARADDYAQIWIDNGFVGMANTNYSGTTALSAGCHTIYVKLTNGGVLPGWGHLTAALALVGSSTAIVVTDTSWRVSAGSLVAFASPNYYEDPSAWAPARVMGVWNTALLPWGGGPATWASYSGDSGSSYITTVNSNSGNVYPAAQYSWFRNTQGFTVATPTSIKISNYCDDRCEVYLDDSLVYGPAAASGLTTTTITVQPGKHNFGVRLYNLSPANISAFLFAAVKVSDGSLIMRSDASWDSTTFWSPNANDWYSYDTSFVPTPNPTTAATVKVLVVGGGGGGGMDMGGGGGGGGVIYNAAYTLTTDSSIPVTVGAGGTGGPAGSTNGQPGAHQFTIPANNGSNSIFGSLVAIGGGAGGSSYQAYTPGIRGTSGGSGGGAGGYNASSGGVVQTGGLGITGQGNRGGNDYANDYYPAGGGGAGAAAIDAPAQPHGGAGIQYSAISPYYWGGGGGGASYNLATGGNGGIGGGGGGAVGVTTGGAGINNGSAGGGGSPGVQTNTPGGNAGANTGGGGGGGSHYNANNKGGNGGSGIVIISYPTGTINATGGTITTSGGNTFHTFTSNGVFTVGPATTPSGFITSGLTLNLDAGDLGSYNPATPTVWNDTSGYGRNFTFVNSPTYSALGGGSILFDGSTQYATSPTGILPSGPTNFAVSIWLKRARNNASYEELMSQYNAATVGGSLYLGFNNSLVRFGDSWDGLTVSGAGTVGTWMNMTFINDATNNNAYVYVNGSLIVTKGSRLTTGPGIGPTLIGHQNAYTEYFGGNIAAIGVYSRSLSSAEVLQNFNAQRARFGL
jgi:hypothetical protein